jgi:mono/diheme cytochrome c family protein
MLNRWKTSAGTAQLVAGLALVIFMGAGAVAAQEPDVGAVAAGAVARSPLERTDRDWVTIANHMRVRANLTGPEVRSVLAFLQATNSDPSEVTAGTVRTLSQVRAPEAAPPTVGPAATDPALVAQGKTLAAEKACLGCHVIEGQGGAVGPTLERVVGDKGADFVRRKLADPTFNNATSMMPNFGLSPEQIEALLAYLNSLRNEY